MTHSMRFCRNQCHAAVLPPPGTTGVAAVYPAVSRRPSLAVANRHGSILSPAPGLHAVIFLTGLLAFAAAPLAAQPQQAYPRVRQARAAKGEVVASFFSRKGIPYPPPGLLLRVFKAEQEIEVWAAPSRDADYLLVKTYPICASSGKPGPKRTRGDLQVPEGFYRVAGFNPASSFHLSFRVDYPNASDRILGRPPLGGDIFIHGDCVTIGCIPITDDLIDELYLMVLDTHDRGRTVPVHIFPARMTPERMARWREERGRWYPFWENLEEGYRYFERRHRPPRVSVDRRGRYVFR